MSILIVITNTAVMEIEADHQETQRPNTKKLSKSYKQPHVITRNPLCPWPLPAANAKLLDKWSLVLSLCKPQANYFTRCDHTSQKSMQSQTYSTHFGTAYLFSAQILRVLLSTFWVLLRSTRGWEFLMAKIKHVYGQNEVSNNSSIINYNNNNSVELM